MYFIIAISTRKLLFYGPDLILVSKPTLRKLPKFQSPHAEMSCMDIFWYV